MALEYSPQGKNVLREITLQNPDAAARLNELRRYAVRNMEDDITEELPRSTGILRRELAEIGSGAYAAPESGTYAAPMAKANTFSIAILAIGLICIALVVGIPFYKFLIQYWDKVFLALGCMLLGAGVILIVRQVGEKPLRNIPMPSGPVDEPLKELEHLAKRSVSRLRTAYHIQVCLVVSVAMLFIGIVSWSIYMVTERRLEYGVAFGSGGAGMLVLSRWKWQPFDKIAKARKMADDADILATGLRLRVASISEIEDPERRASAQWKAILEYVAVS